MSTIENVETQPETSVVNQPRISQQWQKIAALLIWSLIGGFTWWYAIRNNLGPVEIVQSLADLFRSPYGPLIYILAYAARPLLLFSATVITVAAGAIYGPILGVVYVVIGSNTSAMIAYGVGRFFGEGVLEDNDDSASIIQRYARGMRENSFETVILMRFLFLPYDLVNYLSGFLKINWRSFLLATALGSIPGTVAFVLFGASIDISNGITNPSFNIWTFVASITIVIVSIAISRGLRQREYQS